MKTKRIRIKTREDFFTTLDEAATQLDRGKRAKSLRGDFFESLEAVRNVLTPKRLELWQLIRDRRPSSLLELSKMAERDFKSVHRDVSVLVAAGLVELREAKGARGRIQKPISLADSLLLEVA